ncbi:MFS transporter [Angustibacter peucedani]
MTAADHALHRPGTSGFRRLNGAMAVAGLAAFGLLYGTQAVLPQLTETFDVTPTVASLSVSAATGALALAVLPASAVAQRFGRVVTMRVSLVAAVVLTAATAVAPSAGVLVALRGATGLVLAGVVATAMGHVGAQVHADGLAPAMGLYVAGNSLGGVSGRVLTAAVADVADWRWALGVLAVGALVATAVFWRLLPEPVMDDDGSAGPSSAGRAVLVHLRDPALLALLVVPFALMGGFVAVYNYLTFRLAGEPFSLQPATVGLVFLAYLAGSASSALAGRLAARSGRPVALAAGGALMLVGLALTLPDQLVLVVVGLVLFTAGFFAAHAVASGWAPAVARPPAATASALYVLAYYAGSSLFGALVGTAWHRGGWTATAASVGVLTLVGLVAGGAVTLLTRRAPTPS